MSHILKALKGQCHEIFDLWFFHESVSTKPLSIPYKFFRKFSEIFADQGAPPVSLTPVANGKIFNHKSFNYFAWTPMGSRANLKIHFCLQVHFKASAAWYCSHYLPPVSLTPVPNLPPMLLIPMANLPLVSLIPVVHLDLWISPRMLEKIWNSPNGILCTVHKVNDWLHPMQCIPETQFLMRSKIHLGVLLHLRCKWEQAENCSQFEQI